MRSIRSHLSIRGHNADEFAQALLNPRGLANPIPARIVDRVPLVDRNGRVIGETIEYQVPALDGAGNPLIVDGVQRYKKPKFKTVYDPAVITDAEMTELLGNAAAREFSARAADLVNNPPAAHLPNANGNTGSVGFNGVDALTGVPYTVYFEVDAFGTPFVSNIHPGG